MLLSFLAEAAPAMPAAPPVEGMPAWLQTLLAISGGGLGMGILNFILERIRDNRKKIDAQEVRQADERKTAEKADATVEVARVQAKAELESKYFDALETERNNRALELGSLRTELDNAKRTLGHDIRSLRHTLTLTQEVYHQLWTACTMLAMQCRILRSRIKKTEGTSFDEAEFPPIDIEVFDPKKLFSHLSDDPVPGGSEERKISGRVTLQPTDKS